MEVIPKLVRSEYIDVNELQRISECYNKITNMNLEDFKQSYMSIVSQHKDILTLLDHPQNLEGDIELQHYKSTLTQALQNALC